MIFCYNLVWSTFRGRKANANPWRATTLEWQTPDTPPKHGNWGPKLPVVYRWAYDYSVPGARRRLHPAECAAPDAGGPGGTRPHYRPKEACLRKLTSEPWLQAARGDQRGRVASAGHRPVGVHRRGEHAVRALPHRLRDAHGWRRLVDDRAAPPAVAEQRVAACRQCAACNAPARPPGPRAGRPRGPCCWRACVHAGLPRAGSCGPGNRCWTRA